MTNVVNLNVGGVKYSLFEEDIRRHPDCFFERALKDRQGPANMAVNILRDGYLFKFVNGYILNGHLPSNLDVDTIAQVKDEADFYRLPALKAKCEAAMIHTTAAPDISLFSCVALRATTVPLRQATQQFPIRLKEYSPRLLGALRHALAPVFYIDNTFKYWTRDHLRDKPLFKSSTINQPNVTEMIEMASDRKDKHAGLIVIHSSLLCSETVLELSNCMSGQEILGLSNETKIVWQPSKLLVQTPGSGAYVHKPPASSEKHVGTVHVVLNSPFEGGEVNLTLGGQQASLKVGVLQWIAVHADCTHSIAPVTSGARVSLIYDMYTPHGEPELNNQVLNHLHNYRDCSTVEPPLLSRRANYIQANVKKRLPKALDAELDGVDSVDIALQQHYPACHHTPSSALRGGDRTLYELLSKHYDLHVVAITIRNERFYESYPGLYFPPGITPDPKLYVEGNSVLFVPHQLTQQHVIDEYNPERDEPGFLYLISALRVRKKLE